MSSARRLQNASVVTPAAVAAVLSGVKRFPDKEKPATGAVKVTLDDSLVYDELDDKTPSVASLTKGMFVERLARPQMLARPKL